MKIKKFVALLGMLLMLVSISVGAESTAEASIVKYMDYPDYPANYDVGRYMDTDSIRVYPDNSRYEVLTSIYPDFSEPFWYIFVKSPDYPGLYIVDTLHTVETLEQQGIKDIAEISYKTIIDECCEYNYGYFFNLAYPAGQYTKYNLNSLEIKFLGQNPRHRRGAIDGAACALLGAVIASHNGQSVRCRTITEYNTNRKDDDGLDIYQYVLD